MANTIKLIEKFVADQLEGKDSYQQQRIEQMIAVAMNEPAIRRRWLRVNRLSPALFAFRGWRVPGRKVVGMHEQIPPVVIAIHVDELGNAFVLFDNGDRKQYLHGEKIA